MLSTTPKEVNQKEGKPKSKPKNKAQKAPTELILSIAVHHLPHNEEELEDINVALSAVQSMWWDFCDHHQAQKGLEKISENSFVSQAFHVIEALRKHAPNAIKLYRGFLNNSMGKSSCGIAMVDPTRTRVLVVRSFNCRSFGFPKGKMEDRESPLTCALRETFEETGFRCDKYVNPKDVLQDGNNYVFVAFDVPTNVKFKARFEGEIEETKWVSIADFDIELMIRHSRPFMKMLKAFIKNFKDVERPIDYRPYMKEDTKLKTPAILEEPFDIQEYEQQLAAIWE